MSVRIRLTKTGKKHQISYRIVAQDSRTKRDGKFLEILGFYNPRLKSAQNLNIKKDRYDWWLERGAQPTGGVAKVIRQSGSQVIRTSSNQKAKPNSLTI